MSLKSMNSMDWSVHPHVRGADVGHAAYEDVARRFIPTCVGQMFVAWKVDCTITGSSPRAWGRFAGEVVFHGMVSGSSPRAWGRFHGFTAGHIRLRFIPTCVGQMYPNGVFETNIYGSSPRAWGRCFSLLASSMIHTVHPHVRGADAPEAVPWGLLGRFIPTCVGQINGARFVCHAVNGSSPRAWGRFQNGMVAEFYIPVHPHVRGADAHARRAQPSQKRFIPTCVGQIAGLTT